MLDYAEPLEKSTSCKEEWVMVRLYADKVSDSPICRKVNSTDVPIVTCVHHASKNIIMFMILLLFQLGILLIRPSNHKHLLVPYLNMILL